MVKKFVLLLKSSLGEDKYTPLLQEAGINAKHIPSITCNFINEGKLKECLEDVQMYSGIIFTSATAVNAVASAFETCAEVSPKDWKGKMNFSVGEATAGTVCNLLNLDTIGSESGSSSNLATLISDSLLKSGRIPCDKPFIYPCSNIRKNTLPDMFQNLDIKLHEINCYETVPHPEFKDMWEKVIAKEGLPEILVFFSPSGVQFTKDIIKEAYSANLAYSPKFVAIGASTLKALSDADMKPCLSAEKPNAQAVIDAIKSCGC